MTRMGTDVNKVLSLGKAAWASGGELSEGSCNLTMVPDKESIKVGKTQDAVPFNDFSYLLDPSSSTPPSKMYPDQKNKRTDLA